MLHVSAVVIGSPSASVTSPVAQFRVMDLSHVQSPSPFEQRYLVANDAKTHWSWRLCVWRAGPVWRDIYVLWRSRFSRSRDERTIVCEVDLHRGGRGIVHEE